MKKPLKLSGKPPVKPSRKPEIMAPAGSFESLAAAIDAGCDSVYFGVTQLNMRARSAHNFSLEELREVVERCRKAGAKTYVTLNTLLYDHDLELMKTIMETAKAAGATAVIVQDVAAIQYAQKIKMPIHASTQLSISNFESVKFYAKFADTIVLAREVDLPSIAEICRRVREEGITGPSGELVRIEVFVHGALCIAQAGRCQMSLLQTNTSAQRGACLHECRKKYRVIDDETGKEMQIDNQYIMSPKDLCTLPFLDKMVDAGISVFKIEGRGRTPLYVDTVVRVYREAVDAVWGSRGGRARGGKGGKSGGKGGFTKAKIDKWISRLRTVYNRGFSDGYYLGKALPDWSAAPGNQATEQRIFAGVVNHYFPKTKIAEFNIQANEMRKNDKYVIMGKTTGILRGSASSMYKDEAAVETSGKPSLITVPVGRRVRKNDKIYLIKESTSNANIHAKN